MCICIFSIITPVFSVTWSSEIILICWFAAQETFLIIINAEIRFAAQYFCGNGDKLHFHESSKEQHLFEIEIFSNIINVFAVTFDQFNASLMNKSINFFRTPNFWAVVCVCEKTADWMNEHTHSNVPVIVLLF